MDHFGIGNAVQGMLNTFYQSSRRTGRTTSLLASLKDGDRVACVNQQEARRMTDLCRERNLKVECVVVSTRDPSTLFERGTPKGRTVFDHTWVEQFYTERLLDAQQTIDHLQREASGFGEAHIETRRKAEELSWHLIEPKV